LSTSSILLVLAVAVSIVVVLHRLRSQRIWKAERTRSRQRRFDREKEQDRLDCRAAASALQSESGATAPVTRSGPGGDDRAWRDPAGRRGRSAGSTAFDPDLPSS